MNKNACVARRLSLCSALICCLGHGAISDAGIIVRFDQEEYVVSGPNVSFDAQILIDNDDSTPEPEPLATELFSFAVEATFDAAKADVPDLGDVVVPPSLDHFGFADSALRHVAPGVAAAKGNVSPANDPVDGHGDPLLTTITITNLATGPDTYLLELGPYITLGQNEELFVDVDGVVLDPNLSFGTARVRVLPESLGQFPLLFGAFAFFMYRRISVTTAVNEDSQPR